MGVWEARSVSIGTGFWRAVPRSQALGEVGGGLVRVGVLTVSLQPHPAFYILVSILQGPGGERTR